MRSLTVKSPTGENLVESTSRGAGQGSKPASMLWRVSAPGVLWSRRGSQLHDLDPTEPDPEPMKLPSPLTPPTEMDGHRVQILRMDFSNQVENHLKEVSDSDLLDVKLFSRRAGPPPSSKRGLKGGLKGWFKGS